jgi:glyoxylase I family protein
MLEGLHHIAIICSNYEVSKAFYTEILGLEIVRETYRRERDSFKLDLSIQGNYCIELFSFPDFKERASRPEALGLRHLAFKVNNIEKAVEKLTQNNIRCEAIRTDELTNKRFVFFADPDELPIELYEI